MNRALVVSSFLVNFFLLNLFLSLLFFGGFLALERFRPAKSSQPRSNLLLHSLALPPILAYVILVASLVPPVLILEDHGLPLLFSVSHPYHHLCLFHSSANLPASPIFRGILVSSLLLIGFSFFRAFASYLKIQGSLGWLMKNRTILPGMEDLPSEMQSLLREFRETEGIELRLIKASFPVSFLSGIFRPQVILSSSLLQTLSPPQVRTLLQHELAHRLRKDNLLQFLLSFCKNLLFISPTGHLLFRWWRQEAELLCDEIAIQRTARPLDLAEALFRIQKAMVGRKDSRIQPILQSAFFHPDASHTLVERRIRNILRFCDQDLIRPQVFSPPASPLVGLVALATLCFLLLSLLDLWLNPLFLHCQLERIIRCLV